MSETTDPLEKLYSSWSDKPDALIDLDIRAAERKAAALLAGLPELKPLQVNRILDFGCGYGRFIDVVSDALATTSAYGADFSQVSIDRSEQRYGRAGLSFLHLPSLDAEECVNLIRERISDRVDCVALIDVLEHVPDCLRLITALSSITRYFLIKLPIESSVFDNYVLPKEYPSSCHSNGHLREFDVDTVHYFIRKIGLTPLREGLYIYDIDDTFPPPSGPQTLKQRLIRSTLRCFKWACAKLLPKRVFLRLVGGGGYYCLAHFDNRHVLKP